MSLIEIDVEMMSLFQVLAKLEVFGIKEIYSQYDNRDLVGYMIELELKHGDA